jgi:hypothetical protein
MVNRSSQHSKLLDGLIIISILTVIKIYEYFVAPLYVINPFSTNQLLIAILIMASILMSTMILEISEGSIFADTCSDAKSVRELGIPFIITLSNIYICSLLPLDKGLSIYTIAISIKTALYCSALFLKIIGFVMKIFDKK